MSALDLLPPNATPFESAQSATDGVRILASPTELVRAERQPDSCDAAFVPLLAWERSVHHWTPGDEAANRARVASSFDDHGSYGSPAALETEITLDTGVPCRLREFTEVPGAAWPDFWVDAIVIPGEPAPALWPIQQSALKRKNVRDVLAGARLYAEQPAAVLAVGVASFVSTNMMVLPLASAITPAMTVGAGSYVLGTFTILPLGHP